MATLSVQQMRNAIWSVYGGAGWKRRVEHMSDGQVVAVYHRMAAKGKFDGSGSRMPLRGSKKGLEGSCDSGSMFDTYAGEQLSMDEFLR